MKEKRLTVVIKTVVVAVACLVMLFPFFMMLSTSLKGMAEIRSPEFSLIPKSIRWSNYPELFTTGRWGRYFLNSVLITGISTLAAVVINSMAGYAFARLRFRGKGALFGLTMVGLIVPSQVIMLPAYVIMRYIPFAGGNSWAGQGGTGLLNTSLGLVIIYLSGSFGVFLFRQFMVNFPVSLDEAARLDGLSKFRIYWRIYLPLCKPAIATMMVLRATGTWNDYIWPLLMVQKDEMYTVQLALSRFSSDAGAGGMQWNSIMVATALTVLPILILFLFLQRYFVEGIASTGLKG